MAGKVIGGKVKNGIQMPGYRAFKLEEPPPKNIPMPHVPGKAIVAAQALPVPPQTDVDPWKVSGCQSCPKCPANKGQLCHCGRFWYDDDSKPHCGIHDPNPAGDPGRPKRMKWR